MDSSTSVDIIIPAYNAADYICETLDSIILQTHSKWTIYLVDDGSTDNTYEKVIPYLKDTRINYIRHNSNLGESAAVNSGWLASTASLISIISSDDPQEAIWLQGMLAKIVGQPNHVVYYPNLRIISSDGNTQTEVQLLEWNSKNLYERMLCIASAGSIINKGILPGDFIPRDPSVVFPSDLLQMLELGKYGTGCRVTNVLGQWSYRDSNLTNATPPFVRAREFGKTCLTWIAYNEDFLTQKCNPNISRAEVIAQVWIFLRIGHSKLKSIQLILQIISMNIKHINFFVVWFSFRRLQKELLKPYKTVRK